MLHRDQKGIMLVLCIRARGVLYGDDIGMIP